MKRTIIGLVSTVVLGLAPHSYGITVTFDDITLTQPWVSGMNWDAMPASYGGLTWQTGPVSRWELIQVNSTFRNYYQTTLTTPSGDQAAYNGGTDGSWATSLGVTGGAEFTFDGAYFAYWHGAAPGSAGTMYADGYLNNVLVGTVSLALTDDQLFHWMNGTSLGQIDKVVIRDGVNKPWLMDNFTYHTPDGGMTAMLLGMGMLGLGYVRRMVK